MKIGEFVVLITTMFTTDVQVNAIFTMMVQIVNGYSAILVVSQLLNAHTRRKVCDISAFSQFSLQATTRYISVLPKSSLSQLSYSTFSYSTLMHSTHR